MAGQNPIFDVLSGARGRRVEAEELGLEERRRRLRSLSPEQVDFLSQLLGEDRGGGVPPPGQGRPAEITPAEQQGLMGSLSAGLQEESFALGETPPEAPDKSVFDDMNTKEALDFFRAFSLRQDRESLSTSRSSSLVLKEGRLALDELRFLLAQDRLNVDRTKAALASADKQLDNIERKKALSLRKLDAGLISEEDSAQEIDTLDAVGAPISRGSKALRLRLEGDIGDPRLRKKTRGGKKRTKVRIPKGLNLEGIVVEGAEGSTAVPGSPPAPVDPFEIMGKIIIDRSRKLKQRRSE